MRIRHFFLRLSGSGCARVLEISWLLLLAAASPLRSQAPQTATLSRDVLRYVRVHTPRVVLEHVRVVDGTGATAQDDRNIVVEGNKIAAIEPGAEVREEAGMTVLSLRGYSVIPGLVGMHDHLYYVARPDLSASGHSEPPLLVPQMTFPRLDFILPLALPLFVQPAAWKLTPTSI